MDILQYINKMNRLYGSDPTPVRYNTQQYLQGGRVGMKPGGLVEPGVVNYGDDAKTKYKADWYQANKERILKERKAEYEKMPIEKKQAKLQKTLEWQKSDVGKELRKKRHKIRILEKNPLSKVDQKVINRFALNLKYLKHINEIIKEHGGVRPNTEAIADLMEIRFDADPEFKALWKEVNLNKPFSSKNLSPSALKHTYNRATGGSKRVTADNFKIAIRELFEKELAGTGTTFDDLIKNDFKFTETFLADQIDSPQAKYERRYKSILKGEAGWTPEGKGSWAWFANPDQTGATITTKLNKKLKLDQLSKEGKNALEFVRSHYFGNIQGKRLYDLGLLDEDAAKNWKERYTWKPRYINDLQSMTYDKDVYRALINYDTHQNESKLASEINEAATKAKRLGLDVDELKLNPETGKFNFIDKKRVFQTGTDKKQVGVLVRNAMNEIANVQSTTAKELSADMIKNINQDYGKRAEKIINQVKKGSTYFYPETPLVSGKFLKQSIASQIRTMDGETIAQYKNIPEYEDCFNMQGGKNPIVCLTKKAENKPKEFARNSANIAKATEGTKSSAQMINFLKKFRKLGKGAGWFAVGEAAFAPLIGIPMWAQGAPKDEILHSLTWGAAGKKREDKILERMSDAGKTVYRVQKLEGDIALAQKAFENAPDTGYQKLQAQKRLNELRKEYEAAISMLQNPDTGEFNQNLVDKGFEEIEEAGTYFQDIQSQQQKDSAAWMTPKVTSVMEKVVDRPASAFTNLVLGSDWKKNLSQHPSSTKYPHSPATLGQHLSYDANQPMFNAGGRVPFVKGKVVKGIDEGRRAFMKWLAGITGAGVAGATGLLKWGKIGGKGTTAIKAGDHILQGTPGMPDWFIPLINRITKEGDNVTGKLGTVEREIVHTKKIAPGEEVTVYQNLDTGNVRVEYTSPHNMGEGVIGPVQLEYRAPQVIDEGKHAGKKTNPEFDAVEPEPVGHTHGPDDYAIEWDGENVVGNVDDLMSDTNTLKQFATKKKPTMGEIVESSKKKKAVQKVHENESDYIVSKQGEGEWDDYLPDIDDMDY